MMNTQTMVPLLVFVLLHFNVESVQCSTPAPPADTKAPPGTILASQNDSGLPESSVVTVTPHSVAITPNNTSSEATVTVPTTPSAKKPNSSVLSIPTIDFSKKKAEPPPEVVDTCNKKDVCIKGLCLHGTCMTKPCSTDIMCNCNQGFTGQFCDKNVTEVELMTTVSIGNPETSTDPSVKNKHHVNGNVDNNSGNSDNGIAKVDKGQGETGINHTNNDKKTENNGNNTNASSANGTQGNGQKKTGTDRNNNNGANGNTDVVQTGTVDNGVKNSEKGTMVKSYVKGPETVVPSENSTLSFMADVKEIMENTPAVILKKDDVVTIATTEVRNSKVGMSSEIRNAVLGNSPYSENSPRKTARRIKTREDKKSNVEILPDSLETQSKTLADTSDKKINAITNERILNGHVTQGNENSGSINLPTDPVNRTPLFANSEIKITIETGDRGITLDNNGLIQMETIEQSTPDTASIVVNNPSTILSSDNNHNSASNTKSSQSSLTDTTAKESKLADAHLKETPVKNKEPSPQGEETHKRFIKSGTRKDNVAAKQNTNVRQMMKSDVLSPFLQLMNIFGSEKFVENVSAVKIEIITKTNNTNLSEASSQETNTDISKAT